MQKHCICMKQAPSEAQVLPPPQPTHALPAHCEHPFESESQSSWLVVHVFWLLHEHVTAMLPKQLSLHFGPQTPSTQNNDWHSLPIVHG